MRFKEPLAVSFRRLPPLEVLSLLDRWLAPECSQLDLLVVVLIQQRKQGSPPRMTPWGLQVAVLHPPVTEQPRQPMSILSAPEGCK